MTTIATTSPKPQASLDRPLQFRERLPVEVRLQIYEQYLREPRVVEMQFNTYKPKSCRKSTFHWIFQGEPLLCTCYETREVALRHGYFLFGSPDRPGIYFRKSDILFLSLNTLLKLDSLISFARYFQFPEQVEDILGGMRLVENLAIEWGALVSRLGFQRICRDLGRWLPNVKKVSITIPGVRYVTSAVEPPFLKGQIAELHPINGACVLPTYTKHERNEPVEDGTWDTCGIDLTDKIRSVFSSSEGRSIDIEACILHRTRLPKSPLKLDLLMYRVGALGEERISANAFNSTIASSFCEP